ncbi:MAG TPA: hypothetical protein ACFYD3_01625 [Candidatus Hypogeohydataceae bacterium YC41]
MLRLSAETAKEYDKLIAEDNLSLVEERLRELTATSIAFMNLEKIREACRMTNSIVPCGTALKSLVGESGKPGEIDKLKSQLGSTTGLETKNAIGTFLQEKESLRDGLVRDLLDLTGLYKTPEAWAAEDPSKYKKDPRSGYYRPSQI